MKPSIKILMAGLLMWTGSAQAELSWVTTPLWRTLYQDQQVMKIVPQVTKNLNLDSECQQYQSMLTFDDGSMFDDWRKNSVDSEEFSAVFKVDKANSDALAKSTINSAVQAEQSTPDTDALPFYTLPVAGVQPFKGQVSDIHLAPGPNSAAAQAKKLGLQPLTVQLNAGAFPDITVTVHGRDAVCDLYYGRSTLEAYSSGIVQITLDQQIKLQGLYAQVEKATATAMSRRTPIFRALSLGWQLGELLYPLTHDAGKTATYIETVVSSLFDENVQPNSLWTISNNAAYLPVNGAATANFHITLEK